MDELFLQRMRESLNESTKSLIPLYLQGCRHVLDVGCADGALLDKIKELYPDMICEGVELDTDFANVTRAKGYEVYAKNLADYRGKMNFNMLRAEAEKSTPPDLPDAVVFSSVLHEVSSYDQLDVFYNNGRFTKYPIIQHLIYAHDVLPVGGKVIIRDGLEGNPLKDVTFSFKDHRENKFIDWYQNTEVCQVLDSHFYKDIHGNFKTDERTFKELMRKVTWGEESWERESKEKVGILPLNDWIDVALFTGYEIKMISTSSERYFEHLRKKINCRDLENALNSMTILMILEKK